MLGESLRAAREAAELSIEDVADRIRRQEEEEGRKNIPKLSSYVQWVSRQERGKTLDHRHHRRYEIWLGVLGLHTPQVEAAFLTVAGELAGLSARVHRLETILDGFGQPG